VQREIPVVVVTHDLTPFSGLVAQVACVNRRLFYHPHGEITGDMLEEVYGCPVELVSHGVPHRVLAEHGGHAHGHDHLHGGHGHENERGGPPGGREGDGR
jgi:zinc transport system ATP-binding protein